MTGLQLLSAMSEGKLPPPTIATTMPMEMIDISEGRVVFNAKANNTHLNPLGGVHGGFATTVLDSVTGCAVHTMLEAGVGYGTVELDVKMMRPVPLDEQLVAEGKVLSLTRSIGFSEGTLRDAQGKILAHATATCMLIR